MGRVLDCDGKILLLGVDHDANTTLHFAELLAGVHYRSPKHITVLPDGQPTRIDYLENDHCCQLFRRAGTWLKERGVQSEGIVGHAPAKIDALPRPDGHGAPPPRARPLALIHPKDADCAECAEVWGGIPV